MRLLAALTLTVVGFVATMTVAPGPTGTVAFVTLIVGAFSLANIAVKRFIP